LCAFLLHPPHPPTLVPALTLKPCSTKWRRRRGACEEACTGVPTTTLSSNAAAMMMITQWGRRRGAVEEACIGGPTTTLSSNAAAMMIITGGPTTTLSSNAAAMMIMTCITTRITTRRLQCHPQPPLDFGVKYFTITWASLTQHVYMCVCVYYCSTYYKAVRVYMVNMNFIPTQGPQSTSRYELGVRVSVLYQNRSFFVLREYDSHSN
jgi:hypothetical protein